MNVSPKTLRIDQGNDARFICSASSETTSTVQWSRDSDILPSEAVVQNGLLTIKNVKRKHSGLYTCTGSNQHSVDKVSVHLRVGGKVIIVSKFRFQYYANLSELSNYCSP